MLFSVLLHNLAFINGCLSAKKGNDNTYVGDCIEEIAKRNFAPNSSLLTVLKTELFDDDALEIQDDVIKRLNFLLRWVIKVVDNENAYFFEDCFAKFTNECMEHAELIPEHKTKHLFLVVENLNSLTFALENYMQIKTFNVYANVLIYYAKNSPKAIPKIFATLWSHRFYKSVVVAHHKDFLRIFGFDINFESETCADEYDIKILGTFTKNTSLSKSNLFHIDIPKVFNCSIDVITTNITPYVIDTEKGIEIFLIKDIADHLGVRLNITMDKMPGHWGIKISNTVWGGRYGIVQNNSVIGIGAIPSNVMLHEEFFMSTGYLQECMIWVSPTAQLVPEWKVVFMAFSPMLKLSCLFVFVIGAFSLKVTSYFSGEFVTITHNFFNSFQIMLGSVVCRQPKSRSTRLVFMSLALCNMVLATLYQGSLTNIFQHPPKQHQIQDQEEILKYGVQIAGPTVFQYVFFNNPSIYNVYKTYPKMETLDVWVHQAAKFANVATPSIGFYVRYRLSQNDPTLLNANGEPRVTILKDPIFCYNHHFIMPRGFLLAKSFDRLVNKYSTYGHLFRWEKNYYKQMEKSKALRMSKIEGTKLKPNHFKGAFLTLVFGYVLGSIALLFEVVSGWQSKVSSKKKNHKI